MYTFTVSPVYMVIIFKWMFTRFFPCNAVSVSTLTWDVINVRHNCMFMGEQEVLWKLLKWICINCHNKRCTSKCLKGNLRKAFVFFFKKKGLFLKFSLTPHIKFCKKIINLYALQILIYLFDCSKLSVDFRNNVVRVSNGVAFSDLCKSSVCFSMMDIFFRL